jgi:acyl-[acyl-carrier-protein]-phospholipid O-acyltransferase/long-chain-fatty-acid--[acyl-carrier-protein] ligase
MRQLLRPLLRGLARLLFRVDVRLQQADFSHQRLLVVANHESFLDGLLIGLFLPIDPVFVVHTGIANNFWFRILLSQVDYLAVDPTSPMAMKRVIRLIESGRPVVIFPEGRITLTGSLMKVYDGPAFVAAKTGATVIPVRLDGAARSYFSRLSGKYPKEIFPKIRLTVLPERHFPMPEAPTAKLRRRKSGEAMRRLMQEMIFASRPQQTLYSALCDAAEIFGRRRRLLEDVKQIEYSYNDLLKMALMLGRQIERISRPGEKVGLLLPNLVPTIGLIFGLSARQRVPAMLNYSAGTEAMQAACTAAEIRTVVTSRAFVEQAKLGDKLAGLERCATDFSGRRARADWPGDKLWLIGYAIHFPRWFELPTSPEEAAVVLFTSGSEGKPKGVVLPHRAILANIAQIRSVIDFSVDDKVLNALPIFHSFGLTAGALLPVLTGASLFLYPVTAALPGDPRAGLRPWLHGAVRHLDLPCQLRQICPPLRFLPPALRRRRRREAVGSGAWSLVREIRRAHLRRLRRHRDRTGAGGEHADGLQDRHRRQPAAGYRTSPAAGAGHRPGRHPACARPQRDGRLSQGRPARRAAAANFGAWRRLVRNRRCGRS